MDENAPLVDYTGVGVWVGFQSTASMSRVTWKLGDWIEARMFKISYDYTYQSTLHWLAVF